MKTKNLLHILWVAAGLGLLAGCAGNPQTSSRVQAGMTRDELQASFGAPLRIEHPASGGEDWYYRFSSLQAQPFGGAQSRDEFGQQSISAPQQLQTSQQTVELPVHISPDGHVVPPVPQGRVVRN